MRGRRTCFDRVNHVLLGGVPFRAGLLCGGTGFCCALALLYLVNYVVLLWPIKGFADAQCAVLSAEVVEHVCEVEICEADATGVQDCDDQTVDCFGIRSYNAVRFIQGGSPRFVLVHSIPDGTYLTRGAAEAAAAALLRRSFGSSASPAGNDAVDSTLIPCYISATPSPGQLTLEKPVPDASLTPVAVFASIASAMGLASLLFARFAADEEECCESSMRHARREHRNAMMRHARLPSRGHRGQMTVVRNPMM